MPAIGERRIAWAAGNISQVIQSRSRRSATVVIVSCGGSSLRYQSYSGTQGARYGGAGLQRRRHDRAAGRVSRWPGSPDFLKWFEEENSRALEDRLRDAYEVNGQTAWSLLTKAERYRIHLVSDLPDEVVRPLRMVPARSLNDALSEIDSDDLAYIMPHGARFLPRL